jgi:hypothetical protein
MELGEADPTHVISLCPVPSLGSSAEQLAIDIGALVTDEPVDAV